MVWLILASLVWAFSFGLIKHVLHAGGTDMFLVGAVRMGLSFLLFAPFLRPRRVAPRVRWALVGIGAVQYGMMYLTYLNAYRFLEAHQIALLTIFTPFYVALLCDLRRRRFTGAIWCATLIAVLGSGVLLQESGAFGRAFTGFMLVQASNLCFALGQVAYRHVLGNPSETRDRWVFSWLYLGGLVLTLPVALLGSDWMATRLNSGELLTLLYLGLIPSGLGFYLWNRGARRVKAGTLAVMNNAKIPLAVLVALVLFGERASLWRLAVSLAAMVAAVAISERAGRPRRFESRETL